MPQKNLDVVKEDNGSGREQLLRLLGSWRNRRRNTGRKQLAATALLSSENSSCVEKEYKERGTGTLQGAGLNTLWFPGLGCLPGG